jgi:hypothetical protein
MATQATCDIGLIGLAVMGENLALNIANHGYSIAVFNRTTSVTAAFTAGRGDQPNVVGCHTLEDLVAALKPPRKVMMMVKAGRPSTSSFRRSCRFCPPAMSSSTAATRSIPTPSGGRKRSRLPGYSTSARGSRAAKREPSRAQV